ncbi:MAG: branched-chain amino acid ABC transporter permease [Nanoarchaeota archaeon]
MLNPYFINIIILVGIYSILAVSLNLVLGFTGLINLGHVALFGVGAYTSALLTKAGAPFIVGFFSAGLTAALFGFIIIFATKKLKGDYFALASLGFAFVIGSLMLNLQWLTRGPLGIVGIERPNIFGFVLNTPVEYLIFVIIIASISIFAMRRVVNSPFGRLLHAVRNDEIGLRVLGKNTFLIKIKTMIVAGFFAGLAGSLFAHYIRFIEPSSFFLSEIIFVLSIVIIGGIASISGSVVATALLLFIPEILRFLPLQSNLLGAMRQIIYSILLLVILVFRPRGLLGRIDLE